MSKIEQGERENIHVYVRVRPLTRKEVEEGRRKILHIDHKENVVSLDCNNANKKGFKFDQVFPEDMSQLQLYRCVATPIVEKTLQGYNGTIFAYGQTGTGKTYTMAGNLTAPDFKGIMPNCFTHIFSKISQSSGDTSYAVTATYMEIYNEEIRDLLSAEQRKLMVHEKPEIGVYVKDLMGFTVDSVESITDLLNRGNKNRVTRATLMNEISSRSHAIFTLIVESRDNTTNKITIGKLNLVDLAGSERASRTQATGERLREASNINLSLSVLGNVISALVDGKSSHIPYRNSKLTRLLQDSLGGNSKTAMIATISPADIDSEETICTLRYAARVKHIENHVKVNVGSKGLIAGFETEIAELQDKILQLTMQESKEVKKTRKDKSKVDNNKVKCIEELEKIEEEKSDLMQKISMISKKILVGGENLLEKVQYQAFLLENTDEEIKNLEKTREQLEEALQKKGQERVDVEQQYSTLQDEDAALTTNIKNVSTHLNEVKEEFSEKEHEYQREMEQMLDNQRLLMRENQLSNLMINCYIPKEYLKKIRANLVWNGEVQEYEMKGVAYTGNNMRKVEFRRSDYNTPFKFNMKPVYHQYAVKKPTKIKSAYGFAKRTPSGCEPRQ